MLSKEQKAVLQLVVWLSQVTNHSSPFLPLYSFVGGLAGSLILAGSLSEIEGLSYVETHTFPYIRRTARLQFVTQASKIMTQTLTLVLN